MASVPIVSDTDRAAQFRFTVDGTREGPFGRCQTDATDGDVSDLASLAWVITGLSGSHTFALQWEKVGTPVPDLDTTRVRNFQIIEIP
jgi:hypothetical protein